MFKAIMFKCLVSCVRVSVAQARREVICHPLSVAMSDDEVALVAALVVRELGAGSGVESVEMALSVERQIERHFGVTL